MRGATILRSSRTGLATLSALSAVAGIAYVGNHEALNSEVKVSLTMDPSVPPPSPPVDPVAQKPVRGGVTVLVPAGTTREFLRQLREQPNSKTMLAETLSSTRAAIEEELRTLQLPPDEVLVDLTFPLPTGEQSFLHVGGFNLPSLGYKALQPEPIPLAIVYQADAVQADLGVDIQIVDDPTPARPLELGSDAIYLGSIRVGVSSKRVAERLSGTARIRLDLDGAASRRAAQELNEELESLPADSARARQIRSELGKLQARIEKGRELSDRNFTGLLKDALTGQELKLEIAIGAAPGELASSHYDFWLGADTNGDGRADIHLSERSRVEGLDKLTLDLTRLESVGEVPSGRLAATINTAVREELLEGLRGFAPRAAQEVRVLAGEEVAEQFRKAVPEVERRVNGELTALYNQGHYTLPSPSDRVGDFPLDLGAVSVGPGGVGLSVHRGNGHPPSEADLGRADLAVRIQPDEFRLHLTDKSQGGLVDWDGFMSQLRQANRLKRLQFGRNSRGETVYPRVVMRDGRPVLRFDVNAKLRGLVSLPGSPDPGEIIDGIISLPGGVIDTIGGRKPIFDATLHTGVEIPVEFGTEGGLLRLRAGAGVRFTEAEHDAPFELINLLPTRLISNTLTKLLLEVDGGATLGEKLKEAEMQLDLSRFGITPLTVEAEGAEGEVPGLRVRLETDERAAAAVDRLVGRQGNIPSP